MMLMKKTVHRKHPVTRQSSTSSGEGRQGWWRMLIGQRMITWRNAALWLVNWFLGWRPAVIHNTHFRLLFSTDLNTYTRWPLEDHFFLLILLLRNIFCVFEYFSHHDLFEHVGLNPSLYQEVSDRRNKSRVWALKNILLWNIFYRNIFWFLWQSKDN